MSNLSEQQSIDLNRGLSQTQAELNREVDGCLNIVDPPIRCPAWACVILPCIKRIPSVKLFSRIEPSEAEILRDSEWMVYDATSVVRDDIVKLTEGDIVPADGILIEVSSDEILVDLSGVNGEQKPRIATKTGGGDAINVCYGSRVLQGSGLMQVTHVGPNTLLAKLMKTKKWPPSVKSSDSSHLYSPVDDNDNELPHEILAV